MFLIPKFETEWLPVDEEGYLCWEPTVVHYIGEVKSFKWLGLIFSYYVGEIVSVEEFAKRFLE